MKKQSSSSTSKKVKINVTNCRYEVVRKCALARDWKLVDENKSKKNNSSCNITWVDVSEIQDKFRSILPYQKINHFPGMSNIARKSRLAKNLQVMKKFCPAQYDFVPKTWCLPSEYNDFASQFNTDGLSSKTFIIKPDAGCQGRGVFLTRKLEKVNRGESLVAQRYIRHPLLIDGKKFDLRVYVLLTSLDPLEVYVFQDGLVRLCTAEYVTPSNANLEQRFMHLTNYAINKHSEDYVTGQDDGGNDDDASKRSIKWFKEWMKDQYGIAKSSKVWEDIGDVCLKTLLAVQPLLKHEYASTFTRNTTTDDKNCCCFAILGFDVMLDVQLKPWLIEVNHLPSFACDSELDRDIKTRLIEQTLELLKVSKFDEEAYREAQSKSAQERLYGGGNQSDQRVEDDGRLNSARSTSSNTPRSTGEAANRLLNRDELVAAMTFFYTANNPEKMSDVPKIVEKYYDNQRELDANLQVKYAVGLVEILTDMQQQQSKSTSETNSDVVPEVNAEENHSDPQNNLIDFVQIYPAKCATKRVLFDRALSSATKHLTERQMRLQAPLQQSKGRDMKLATTFPAIKGAKPAEEEVKKPLAVPGPAQFAAATRLSRGDSSCSSNPVPAYVAASLQASAPRATKDAAAYGQAYRQRLQGIKQKPTVRLTQVNFGSFPDLPF